NFASRQRIRFRSGLWTPCLLSAKSDSLTTDMKTVTGRWYLHSMTPPCLARALRFTLRSQGTNPHARNWPAYKGRGSKRSPDNLTAASIRDMTDRARPGGESLQDDAHRAVIPQRFHVENGFPVLNLQLAADLLQPVLVP